MIQNCPRVDVHISINSQTLYDTRNWYDQFGIKSSYFVEESDVDISDAIEIEVDIFFISGSFVARYKKTNVSSCYHLQNILMTNWMQDYFEITFLSKEK